MGSKESEPELPIKEVVQTSIIPTRDDVDPDVLATMNCLGCFREKEKVVSELLGPKYAS